MIYPIVKYGDPVLETKAAKIEEFDTPDLHKLIDDVLAHHFAEQNAMLNGLTRAEQRQLAELLSKLEVSLEINERLHEERGRDAG